MNKFKKLVLLVAGAMALVLSGCSALPEGSKKPSLEIDTITTAENSGVKGFDLTFKLKHDSLEALKIRKITTLIAVNDTLVAQGEDEPDELIVPPRREITVKRFVPANLIRNVAGTSLQSPLFYGEVSCTVKVQFSRDEEDSFNPNSTYHGILNSALNVKTSN